MEQRDAIILAQHDLVSLQRQLEFILARIADRLDKLEGLRGTSIFYGDMVMDALTASRLVATDADKILSSTDADEWITGTAKRVTVTDDGDGSVTLTGPQDIDTDADVEFDSLTLGDLTASKLIECNASKKLISSDSQRVYIQDAEPSSPRENDIWIDLA